jgi:hypothetical protein
MTKVKLKSKRDWEKFQEGLGSSKFFQSGGEPKKYPCVVVSESYYDEDNPFGNPVKNVFVYMNDF